MKPTITPKPGERWINNTDPNASVKVWWCNGDRLGFKTSDDTSWNVPVEWFLRDYHRDDSARWPRTTKGKPPKPFRTQFSLGELLRMYHDLEAV